MIGMMYLVLTALLALNISKEILNGFVKVETVCARPMRPSKASPIQQWQS